MEFVASMALRTLLPKLAQLLQSEYKLQKGAKKGIEDMCKELEAMDAFLRKVSEVPRDQLDEQHKIWAREVRDLSYDMEDMVDTFMVEVEGPDASSSKSTFEKFFSKMKKKVNKAMTRREISKEIMDIKKRVIEVADRHERYNYDAKTPATKTLVDPRITAPYTEVSNLVGIDEAKKEIITRLTKGDDDKWQARIISIAGFGGLGKTTLARAVFDDIQGNFDCSLFVSVSRNPDIYKLIKGILLKLRMERDGNIPSGADLDVQIEDLIDFISQILRNERYLIVIDDIWDIAHWNTIRRALNIENNKGSRVITTTRIVDVAQQVGGCYRLQPLTSENSENLFYGRIFGDAKCPEQFSEVSKKILKKCGGVPLAIVTTSSLLANKSEKNIRDWNDVYDSIGLGLGSNPDLDSMRKILLLSYYDLPFHLKTCLLYLSIFPEDYEIRKDWLIWRWVAEDFVERKHKDQSFLECGENYFNELVNRSLIQPVGMDVLEGTAKGCRVHDMVLDLIVSLSREECFITTISGDDGKNSLKRNQVRRLSLHDATSDWPSMNMPKLRSLTIFNPAAVVIVPTSSLSYHLLRVLDLGGKKVKDIGSLGFLGKLSHLRYLRLSSSNIYVGHDWLPEEIGKLRFLQTLDLSGTSSVGQLPSSFTGLTQLKCLRGSSVLHGSTSLPDGLMKKLTSLEVLEGVTLGPKCFAEELGFLTGLRALKVSVWLPEDDKQSRQACGEAMAESLGKLHKIESLSISIFPSYPDDFVMDGSVDPPLGNLRRLRIKQMMIKKLPTWINGASLPALSYLHIVVLHERRGDMQALGTLPCLRHLTFKVLCRAEQAPERSVVGPRAFPSVISCDFAGYEMACSMVPSVFLGGAMLRLQDYKFNIHLEDFCGSGAPYTVDDLALAHLPSLHGVTADTFEPFDRVSAEVWRSVEEKLKYEVAVHPNNPRLILKQSRKM